MRHRVKSRLLNFTGRSHKITSNAPGDGFVVQKYIFSVLGYTIYDCLAAAANPFLCVVPCGLETRLFSSLLRSYRIPPSWNKLTHLFLLVEAGGKDTGFL